MNSREKGFLLLSSHLGDPNRKPLSAGQLRTLSERIRSVEAPGEDRELQPKDLLALGYGSPMTARILELLDQEAQLDYYVSRGKRLGCIPLTRISPGYPVILRSRLGLESPGCLWAKGDLSVLEYPAVALVGSRELREENRRFAGAVGTMAAENGFVLISGNARGADRTAQEACLAAGGKVISIVADRLMDQPERENLLYFSEDGYDEVFTSQRALSRNRCIHALGGITFVAQCRMGKGGTWDGTVKNLRSSWSTVACFRDGSEASLALEQMGAYLIDREELGDFSGFAKKEINLFDDGGETGCSWYQN